jgi:hypothetical protein
MTLSASTQTKASKWFRESNRKPRETNLQWLERHVRDADAAYVVLLGGVDQTAFRLRVAQSRLRQDLTPSPFSHVAILAKRKPTLAGSLLHEISLDPMRGFGFAPRSNGLASSRLDRYASAEAYPNLAVIRLPFTTAAEDTRSGVQRVEEAIKRFPLMRAQVDCSALILSWLAFVWGSGNASNPLLDGLGIPSAVCAELVADAAGVALTLNVASRSSSPEAIWQSARWWGHSDGTPDGKTAQHERFDGAWTVPHWYLSV